MVRLYVFEYKSVYVSLYTHTNCIFSKRIGLRGKGHGMTDQVEIVVLLFRTSILLFSVN